MRYVFPLRLRYLRLVNDLSLDEASVRTGVDRTTLSRLERGLLRPSDEVQQRIEAFWKLPLEDLLQEPTFDEVHERPLHLSPSYIREAAAELANAKDNYEHIADA